MQTYEYKLKYFSVFNFITKSTKREKYIDLKPYVETGNGAYDYIYQAYNQISKKDTITENVKQMFKKFVNETEYNSICTLRQVEKKKLTYDFLILFSFISFFIQPKNKQENSYDETPRKAIEPSNKFEEYDVCKAMMADATQRSTVTTPSNSQLKNCHLSTRLFSFLLLASTIFVVVLI